MRRVGIDSADPHSSSTDGAAGGAGEGAGALGALAPCKPGTRDETPASGDGTA